MARIVYRLAIEAEVGRGDCTVPVENGPLIATIALGAGNFAAGLRRVIFVCQPALRSSFD